MKKSSRYLMILLAGLMIFAFSGYTTFAKTKGPVTISFWFPSNDKMTNAYFFDAAKEFEKTHPQINVEVTALPPGQADVDLKLNAAVLSGTYPDVQSSMLTAIGTRGSMGEFYPLDKLIAKWDDKTDIYQNVFSIGSYKGKLLGLGFYPNPNILVYRKDFFKEAGLDPNHPPANWDELAAYAKKLTIRDGNNVTRAGFDIPAINGTVFIKPFCRQNGAVVIDEKREKPMLDDAKMIGAFDYLMKLKNENVSNPFDFLKKDSIPFVYGKSAMSFMDPAQVMGLLNSKPDLKDKLAFAPVLTGPKKKSGYCAYRLFTIANSSKHKNEAWEFIKFMMSKEQVQERYANLKIPPVRQSMEKDYIAKDPAFNSVIMDYVKNGQGDNVIAWNTLGTKYLYQAWEEAYSGKKAPAQALKDAQANLLKELKNLK